MSLKNACKIWVNRFELVWSLVLFLILFILILGSIALIAVMPVYRAFESAGIIERTVGLFSSVLNGATHDLGAEIQIIWSQVAGLFQDDRRLTLTATLSFFAVVFVFKFLLGYYELPAYQTLEGAMSAGARYRYAGAFISKLGISSRFVLVKIVYTTLYDCAFYAVLYWMLGLFFIPGATVFAAIAVVLYVVLFQALRYTPLVFWGPNVVVSKAPIFQSLGFSVKKSFRHFGSVFGCFACAWVMILIVNCFIGIFTFGVGLFMTIPASMMFVCILNMTLFYGKTGRRYYVAGQIISPPAFRT